EGFYITGYNGLSVTSSKFICSTDLLESKGVGDSTTDACLMNVIQLDDRIAQGQTPCNANTHCNEGNLFANNQFWGFRDTADAWDSTSHKCIFNINTPTTASDNQFNSIHDNVFRIVDASGNLDTSSTADGFCGDAGGTAYVDKNFIYNN